MAAHESAVDHDLLATFVGGVEGDVVEDALHHRREAARADILDIGVHLGGEGALYVRLRRPRSG